jgi:hypothetical protein
MDILNSTWLIKMLEKSSTAPHERLLSLFDILEDWLEAPNMATPLLQNQTQSQALQAFLAQEAAKAGAAMPEILANQLYFMAISAAQEKLQSLTKSDCNHNSLIHAKSAANALILAQTKKGFHFAKLATYAVAASFAVVLMAAGFLFMLNLNQASQLQKIADLQPALQAIAPSVLAVSELNSSSLSASPEQTSTLMAQLEQMRHGNCQLIEAIQLPDNVKGVYINMIVNGHVSTNLHEQQIAMELLKQTRCNYTPMLMANSTG